MSLLFSMLISCFGFPWHCFNFGHILKVLGLRFFCFLLCFAVVLFVCLCCFILFFVLLLLNSSMITRDLTCDSYTVTFGGGTTFPPLPFFLDDCDDRVLTFHIYDLFRMSHKHRKS